MEAMNKIGNQTYANERLSPLWLTVHRGADGILKAMDELAAQK